MAGVGFRDIVRTLKVCLFTTKLIKSHVKLTPLKSPGNLHLTARLRIFLPATILWVALSWPPRKPTVFTRLARWQLPYTRLTWCCVLGRFGGQDQKKGFPLQNRLFTVLYFPVRSSRSRALRYGLPSCTSIKTT